MYNEKVFEKNNNRMITADSAGLYEKSAQRFLGQTVGRLYYWYE